ncbi:hypothetical protein L7F22_055954 [Adiantum nelumboides]|nr:hypothetical protein [Adiantum nelumboides]
MFLPLSFSALTDGYNASLRLNAVFSSEQLADQSERDPEAKFSLELRNATFEYDEVKKQDDAPKSKKQLAADKKKNKKLAKDHAAGSGTATPTKKADRLRKSWAGMGSGHQTPVNKSTTDRDAQPNEQQAEQAADVISGGDKSEAVAGLNQVGPQITDAAAKSDEAEMAHVEKPFHLENLNMHITPGELVAIVGPVGSGKSTVFEALVGEVKMTSGRLIWGGGAGKIAYCPQSPWIQAATVRENILFGRPFDEERYWEVIHRAELESDLLILPQGDETEIGEKGTTLSGGQKARVTLARALYFDADTYLLDDPLSAVDPHVGKALFNNAILGLKQQGKTVLLVTHAIHVLPHVDRIMTMQDGEIVEMGTYTDLEKANGPFSRWLKSSVAIATFLMGASVGIFTYYAARNLHADAIKRILYAPLNTFFDVQPKGRIMNRMTKDGDVNIGSVVGAIILITVLTHYFIAAVAGVMIFYILGSIVYRRGAREVKRLDAVLRSALYSHFSETLVGLATVRAYGESGRFLQDHLRHVDIENRAYFFSICNQRFLGVRLDFLGAILVFITAILASVGANTITPSEVGLALSFMLTVSQAFSWATRQVAEVENDMNSAERIQYYATELEQEARQDTPTEVMDLDPAWPKQGAIEFENVKLRYRPGLPIVLKGIDMSIGAGEKTAVVGRTGAGKSSLLTCLLRLIELEEGKIRIDGIDIREVGLTDLRTRIGYLPQDPVLFSGTIRSNLDPFGQYDDARLWDALKRSYLVGQDSDLEHQTAVHVEGEKHQQQQITLDTPLEEEGNNLSLGQRSLVSLARALVKDSQIILLDEATASVDVQTDALIQQTIRTEFAKKTLITIAHRLRTVIAYDRIAVFEQGRLEEYDTPTRLFDQQGYFFQMCQKANISRDDVVRAQEAAHASSQ